MNKEQNHGFRESEIVLVGPDKHYVFGDCKLPTDVLMPDGHGWGAFLPVDEFQNRNGLETENCTAYGTLHALATLGKKKFGLSFQADLSERFLGIMANTGPNGNDPHYVAETLRTTSGVIPEVFLPFDGKITTFQEYFSPKPMTWNLAKIGVSWLKKYKFGHEWVILPGQDKKYQQTAMKEALKMSPLGVAGFAWAQNGQGLYYSAMPYATHWFEVYDFVDGVKWLAFDSYDNTHKELVWDYDFSQVKRYSLDKLVQGIGEADPQPTFWDALKFYISNIFSAK